MSLSAAKGLDDFRNVCANVATKQRDVCFINKPNVGRFCRAVDATLARELSC